MSSIILKVDREEYQKFYTTLGIYEASLKDPVKDSICPVCKEDIEFCDCVAEMAVEILSKAIIVPSEQVNFMDVELEKAVDLILDAYKKEHEEKEQQTLYQDNLVRRRNNERGVKSF